MTGFKLVQDIITTGWRHPLAAGLQHTTPHLLQRPGMALAMHDAL